MRHPFLLFADNSGKIYSHPYLRISACGVNNRVIPKEGDIISLPRGSTLFYFPHRFPVGYDPRTKKYEVLTRYEGKKVYSVAAFLIPGYVRLYNPTYVVEKEENVPLWAYTACGFYGGRFVAAAMKIDPRTRQAPRFYDTKTVKNQAALLIKKFPHNRLYRHLAHCALVYNCLAAKNFFLQRWEAPLPVSARCNARCVGCISLQYPGCTASHERIKFKPTEKELCEVMIPHLLQAKEPIVSFGQGCEGEPLLEAPLISRAVKKVREIISRGTIHMNTNASIPKNIEMLSCAGIDSFRVTIFSVRDRLYSLYFKPRGYSLRDVRHSIKIMKRYNKFVSINLLVFPGFTDHIDEVKSLLRFIETTAVDMIQFRNLNIDPLYFSKKVPAGSGTTVGITTLIEKITKAFPQLKIGYFNLPKEKFSTF